MIISTAGTLSATAGGVTPQPQSRYLISGDGNWVAVVGPAEVDDPDRRGITDVDWHAMGMGTTGGDFVNGIDLRLRDRTHGHYHRPMEAAGGNAVERGDEHGGRGATPPVADGNPSLDQLELQDKATTQQEGDEIVPPEIADVSAPPDPPAAG